MVSYPIPLQIPSMESVRDAVEAALRESLAAALTAIATVSPTHTPGGDPIALTFNPIAAYRQAFITDEDVTIVYPSVVIVSSAPKETEATNRIDFGEWRATIQIEVWDTATDPAALVRMLDRYAAAVEAVVKNPGTDNPITDLVDIVPGTFDMTYSEPDGGTAYGRGVGVRFDVSFGA